MGKPGLTTDRSCSGALSRHIVHRVAIHVPAQGGVHFDAVVPKMAKQTFSFPASTRTMFLNWKVKPIAIHDEKMRHAKKVGQYNALLQHAGVGASLLFRKNPRDCGGTPTHTGTQGCPCDKTALPGNGCQPQLKCCNIMYDAQKICVSEPIASGPYCSNCIPK